LRVVERLLHKHEVVTAASGSGALKILEQRTDFDAVLCDLMMPDVTGMDVYEQILQRNPSLAGRFVFLTGGAFTARAEAFIDRVDNLRLQKPVRAAELHAAIAAVQRVAGKVDGEAS
jgi:CheY-like chemotaxis protein